ncbi:MAG: hypothetical protein M0Z56_11825 [Desulfobacteraceae bacterium]|nr:hypothetical protein [Desulfobacteraceae bacterium]
MDGLFIDLIGFIYSNRHRYFLESIVHKIQNPAVLALGDDLFSALAIWNVHVHYHPQGVRPVNRMIGQKPPRLKKQRKKSDILIHYLRCLAGPLSKM